MRVFEVSIHKHRGARACGFRWPAWWNKVVNNVQVLAYEDHPEQHGDTIEHAICLARDDVWNNILTFDDSEDPRVREISDEEANTKGRAWRPQSVRILDPRKVAQIAEKIGKGVPISDIERRALDPDDDEIGLGRSAPFDVTVIKRQRGQ